MNMQNKMKYIGNIISVLAAVLLFGACSGQVDDTSLPVLSVTPEEIDLADGGSAVFTVSYNGTDVTGKSAVSLATDSSTASLENAVFTPDAVGAYVFVAEYEGKTSNTVTVKVVDTTPVVVESAYVRHVCVFEFTGAWCINCPYGYDLMFEKLSIPSNKKYKENLHFCAFHSDLEGTDTLAIAATQDLYKLCSPLVAGGLAYPSFSIDLHSAGILTEEGIGDFVPSIRASHEDYPAHCGVAVSSVLNSDKTQATVTARLTSELTSEYRMIILVIQNKIKGWQKTTLYPEGEDDYIHSHVVRKVVTAYEKTFTGEKMTESGEVAAGDEVEKSWTVDIAKEWVLENTQIYAIALDGSGHVNNMNVCAIDGGDSGYDMKN